MIGAFGFKVSSISMPKRYPSKDLVDPGKVDPMEKSFVTNGLKVKQKRCKYLIQLRRENPESDCETGQGACCTCAFRQTPSLKTRIGSGNAAGGLPGSYHFRCRRV